ncbi:MAG: TrpB-like pyridoxal-phosphate dependent enzyme, partial [bacterium]
DSPIVSLLHKEKVIEAMALDQVPCFQSAILFSKTEGIIPAPESSHAIHGAVIEALKAKESGEKKTILFNLSGHGNFDFAAYENYLSGNLKDTPLTQESVDKGLTSLPKIPE